MAMMEGLRPGPLFDSLSKNVPENLSALQSKADKYIAAEELAEAKRRRRGKDDHKRKEPDTRRADYREETRYKRPDRDHKRSNNRRPRTLPRRPEFILPPLNAPVAQVLSEIKHEEFVKWPGKIKTDPQKRNRNKYCEFHRDHGHNTEDCFQLREQIADLIKRGGCSTSSRKKHARSAFRSVEEEVYNLSSPCVGDQPPITFGSDDLRGLHLPHDDALVISTVIANFNVQRILIDSGSSADILFISAFRKDENWAGQIASFPYPPDRIWRKYNATPGMDQFTNNPRNRTTPDHRMAGFYCGEVKGDQKVARQCFISAMKLILEDPRETENTKPLEEVVPISIHPNFPDRQVMIGTELTDELHTPQPETPLEEEIPKEPARGKDLAHWILFVDGSSNQHGCGAGLVIRAPSGEQMEYAIRMGFKATNNEAEYEALLAGLRIATELGAQSLEVFSDSQLVVNQVQGDYLAKDARMIAYLGEVKAVSAKIKEFKIYQIPREDNKKADALANLASTFEFISDRLYKRSFSGPLLRCLRPEEAEYVLREIHEDRDAAAYIKKCDKCQRFAPVSRLPHTEMVPMSSPWPFAQWGIDILGPLPQAPLQRKFLIVAIDYFTKWIEAQPLAKITEKNTRDFVWKHLVCRFGVPKVIISDNARQFDNDRFRLFCSDLAISHHFSSPGHPQANGQVEVTNRETPYSMVFGTESVIPVEIGMPSFRVLTFDKETNEAELRLNLDLLEERRERRRATPDGLQMPSRQPNAGKLGPTWEGPYKVIKVSRPGTYWLEDLDGKALSHPWNAEHLKKVLSVKIM
ncbi:hypothetical protein Acr_01g0008020 [Actinidia rufa]|uniref:Uncharacterized protein n=1 Tax=Actinidia rufa TaxID=165716 RepID=A0A7J0E391_9ERIC|nr:hypothetical protein Acr_01g0008020 [Actinidia rufa]